MNLGVGIKSIVLFIGNKFCKMLMHSIIPAFSRYCSKQLDILNRFFFLGGHISFFFHYLLDLAFKIIWNSLSIYLKF